MYTSLMIRINLPLFSTVVPLYWRLMMIAFCEWAKHVREFLPILWIISSILKPVAFCTWEFILSDWWICSKKKIIIVAEVKFASYTLFGHGLTKKKITNISDRKIICIKILKCFDCVHLYCRNTNIGERLIMSSN